MEEVNDLNGHEHNGLAEKKQNKPVNSEVELTKKDTTVQDEESQVTKVTQNGTASVTSLDSAEPSNELSIEPSSNHIEPQLESPSSSLSSDLEPKKEASSSEDIIENDDDEREPSPPVVIVGTLKKKRTPPGELDLKDSKDVPRDDLSPPQTPSIVITESPVQVFEEEYIGEQEDEKVLEQLVNKVQVEVQVQVQEEEPKAVEVEEVKVEVAPTVVEVVTSPAEVTEKVQIQPQIQAPIQETVEVKVEVSPVVVEVTSPPEVKVEKVEEKPEDQADAPVKPARSRPPSVILVDSPKAEQSKKPEPTKPKPETLPKPKVVEPPKSLNPFGDDEEEEEESHEEGRKSIQSSTPSSKSGQSAPAAPKIYPTDLNPFGDEDEAEVEVPQTKPSAVDVSSASLNPFGDFDDEEEEKQPKAPKHIPSPAPRKTLTSTSTTPTPSPQPPKSPHGTRSPLKKRQAPAPPPKFVAPAVGEPAVSSMPSPAKSTQSLNNALDNPSSTCDNSPSTSASSSVANSRTPTPVPRRSKQPTAEEAPDPDVSAQLKQIKSKKRPAPPIPAFKRSLKSSMDEIDAELNQIGDELPVVEQKRQELETWLLDEQKKVNSVKSNTESSETEPTEDAKEPKAADGESTENSLAAESAEYEDKMNEFIDVAKKRCKLAQKQKELMYMKREHKLEETQVDIEFQLRKIMSKQDAQKSEEDKTTEADLLQRMMEIIDERNDIIENMIKDENKEIEDYLLLISKVLPEQAKALTPSALHEAPEGAKEVTSPQPHKHLSASKLLKQKTASTLSLLKLKKKKKKDKDKDKVKQDGGEKAAKPVKDKPDGNVVVVSEPSDDEHEHSIATTENGSLRASMASIDAIPEDTAVSPIPDAKSTRSESRASLPAEPTEGQPKDPELKKHKKSFTISKSTFKKLSKITGVGGHHHNHKEPTTGTSTTGTSTTGSSTNDVTTVTITKSPDSAQPPKITES